MNMPRYWTPSLEGIHFKFFSSLQVVCLGCKEAKMDVDLCSFILAPNVRDKGLRTINLAHLRWLLDLSKNSVILLIQKFKHES